MGKSKPKIPVDDYYLSIHYGLALRLDELVAIRVDEKNLPGIANVTTNGQYNIAADGFFGGDQKRGGLFGLIDVLMGTADQLLPGTLAGRLKYGDEVLTPETAPGFRGFTSVWFHGAAGAARSAGFKWGSNSPTVPPTEFRVRRRSVGLNPDLATWTAPDGYVHVNPAHMIYECTVDSEFGSGVPESMVNIATFQAAAQTLFDEGLFLSTRWTRESEVGEFVKDILTHITAVVYINQGTGLFELKLIRDDYDPETVPEWGPDQIRMEKFSRKSRGEIANRITLSYTNPETGNDETITAIDEASISMQGGEIVNSTISRPMVRNADIAARLVEKEKAVAVAPLASGRLKALRGANGDGSTILPGQVFRLRYPRHLGDDTILCRISEVDYGKTGDRYVKVSWVEDIYSLPIIRGRTGSASFWEDTAIDPVDMQFRAAFTVPYPFVNLVSETGVGDEDYPDGYVGLLGWFSDIDVSGFAIAAPQSDALGGSSVVVQSQTATLSPSSTTLDPIVQAGSSSLRIGSGGGVTVKAGDFIVITPGSDDTVSEWMLVSGDPNFAVDGEITFPVLRGMFDTTPRAWGTGSRVWVVGEDYGAFDQQLRSPGAPVEYQYLTRTSRGQLSVANAVITPFTPTERPHMPFRPANVRVGGVAFGRVTYPTDPATVSVSWVNRNRLTEDSVPLAWTDATVVGEDGQTTEIEIRDAGGNVIYTETGLAGTSFDLDIADFGPGALHTVHVWAERDGIRSLQAHSVEVFIEDRSGYGTAYGVAYGA